MFKKILFTIIQLAIMHLTSLAQTQCPSPCISNGHFNGSTGWKSSHGPLTLSNSNSPTSTGQSLALSHHYNTNMSRGAFTCYNFDSGKTYRVCFWVRNYARWGIDVTRGSLYVAAGKDIVEDPSRNKFPNPSAPHQWIDYSYNGEQAMGGFSPWVFISDTFTASRDWNSLWFYADEPSGNAPITPGYFYAPFQVEIDDVRVHEYSPIPVTVTDDTNGPISGCDKEATLTVHDMSPGATITWPAGASVILPNQAIVRPCSTTTYKIQVTDPTNPCGNCVRDIIEHTVYVDQWSHVDNIVYPTTTVLCLAPFQLEYIPDGPCANAVTYQWLDPHGNIQGTTINPTINATASMTGEWTLKVNIAGRNCAEEHKFVITVGSCCRSNPQFTYSPNTNPVVFTNASNGITHHVASLWDFGDGTSSGLNDPVHEYDVTAPGPQEYDVCLTTIYEDDQGSSCCSRTCERISVPVNANRCRAVADFSYTNPVQAFPNEFEFTEMSSGHASICAIRWYIDGIRDTSHPNMIPVYHHTFPWGDPGPWKVCMVVEYCTFDNNGALISKCKDSTCKIVQLPQGKLSPAQQYAIAKLTHRSNDFTSKSDVKKQTGSNDLKIYPNPTSGKFTLHLGNHPRKCRVVVRDKLRREVYSKDHTFGSNGSVDIVLSDVADGIYSVELISENKKLVGQISVVR